MKILLLISLILLATLFACKKEINPTDTGVITGADERLCPCCGGWFIEIGDSTYIFNQLPADSKLDLANETFPVPVDLNWQKDPDACLAENILVTYISKRQAHK
jgi:hypothetical protein